MSDDVRLSEGTGLAATLLRSAKGDAVPEGASARALAGVLGASGAATALAGASSGASKALGAAFYAKIFGGIVSLSLLGVGAYVWQNRHEAREANSLEGAAAQQAAATANAQPLFHAQPVETPHGVSIDDLPRAPTVVLPTATPSAKVKAEDGEGALGLAEEVKALDEVRGRLRASDGAAALQSLAAYDTRFRTKQLAREATLLRIEALVLVGQRDEAERRARAFASANAGTPAASRALKLAGAAP